MANSAPLRDTIPASLPGGNGPLQMYQVVIDTINEDLDILTPSVATNRIFVVGMWMNEATACNITLKSATTYSHIVEYAANQGPHDKVNGGFIFSTKAGEKLTIRSSAAFGSMILYLVEAPGWKFPA